MNKKNNDNKARAISENSGFNDLYLTPHQYLHFLLEQTEDNVLAIPGDDETSYTCFHMDWDEEKYEKLCQEFDELIDPIKRIANGDKSPEVWETYIRPFYSEEFEGLITEDLLLRDNSYCNDITDEEQALLDRYHAAKAEEYRNRLGGNAIDVNEIIYAQRICKLCELKAPEFIIRNEERFLIQSMAINRYAVDCE